MAHLDDRMGDKREILEHAGISSTECLNVQNALNFIDTFVLSILIAC